MDNWLALFDGQTRYFLDIFDRPVKPDVLRFRGREALSEPFRWDIEFTTPQASIPPEQVLMKYATFRMRSGKNVHGIVTRLEWLSTSKDQSHYRLTLSSLWRSWDTPGSAPCFRTSPFRKWWSRCCASTDWRDLILNSGWRAPTRRVKLSPSGGKRTLSLSGVFCPRWAFTGVRRWTTCAVWIRTYLPTASLTTGLTCGCRTASPRVCLTARRNRSGMCGPGTGVSPAPSPRGITTTGQPPRRWMRRSACVMMGSPPGSITATPRLTVRRVMTPALSRKPNPGPFMPASTTSGNSSNQPAFTCSAMLPTSRPGRCWSRRAMSLMP